MCSFAHLPPSPSLALRRAGRPAWEYSDLALFWDRAFDACSLPDAAAHIERLSARGLATCGRGAVLVAAEYLTSARGAGAGFGAGRAKVGWDALGLGGCDLLARAARRPWRPRRAGARARTT